MDNAQSKSVASVSALKTRETDQKPFTANDLADGRAYVSGTAHTPIVSRGEERVGRIREEFSTRAKANARAAEINGLLFPPEALSMQPTNLPQTAVRIVEDVYFNQWTKTFPGVPFSELTNALQSAADAGWKPDNNTIPVNREGYLMWIQEKSTGTTGEDGKPATSKASDRYLGKLLYHGSFFIARWGNTKPQTCTYKNVLDWLISSEELKRCPITKLENGVYQASDAVIPFKGTKLSVTVLNHYLSTASAYLNWCEGRGWRGHFVYQALVKTYDQLREQRLRLRVLRMEECLALLNAAFFYKAGKYAAFFIHNMFGGSRVFETTRLSPDELQFARGIINMKCDITKTGIGRHSELNQAMLVMIVWLLDHDLYGKDNFNCPSWDQRAVRYLAGFQCNGDYFSKEQKELVERAGTKPGQLGPYPQNACRRTGISAHYQLWLSKPRTVEWAGNSIKIADIWYLAAMTPEVASIYWTMLPTFLAKALSAKGITMELPAGHRLQTSVDEKTAKLMDAVKGIN